MTDRREENLILPLSVDLLREQWDPFWGCVWVDILTPITREELSSYIETGRLSRPGRASRTRRTHLARIAWFVLHGWRDPITVHVGIPSLGYHPRWGITDGNHRFAAAIYRGDPAILAMVDGEIREIKRLTWKGDRE